MTNGKNERKGKGLAKWVVSIVILLIASALGITLPGDDSGSIYLPNSTEQTTGIYSENQNETTNSQQTTQGTLVITMIDVGQGDCFLLEQGDEVALIDCGTKSASEDIIKYLKGKGITKIKYVYVSHPHDDHGGGAQDLIANFEIGQIIVPKIKAEHGTATWYRQLMKAIKSGGYKLEFVKLGTIYNLGDATIKVIGPISDPENEKNNYSTVLKVSFGEMDAIFTGDAETEVERDILESGENIQAEILKVGHHGSDTSSHSDFLDAVNPQYALISCGLGNQHKHPVEEIIQRIEDREIEVYRTDECGTVVVTVTATNITFNCEPGDYLSGIELEEREGAK